jgi:pimeloyl-ACP methyl ester carboxylesterase
METLLRCLDVSSAHVIGSSYGGYVALILALRRPKLVRSLVLAEPPILPLLRLSPLGLRLHDSFVRETIEPARAAFARGDAEDGVRAFVDGIVGKRGSFNTLPDKRRSTLLEAAPELRLEFCTEPDRYMPELETEKLRTLPTPTLLLQGERSPRMFCLIINELERTIPNNERITIPRTGHALHTGNPTAFNRAIFQFLRTLRS